MPPIQQCLLALSFALLFLTGSEAIADSGKAETHVIANSLDGYMTNSVGTVFEKFSEFSAAEEAYPKQPDKKKLLAGACYLYAGFIAILFACEMGIRRESAPEPKLYLVKK